VVLKGMLVCAVALSLAGCMTAQERQAEAVRNIDAHDDTYCRNWASQVAQASHAPNADASYAQCRQTLLQARMNTPAAPPPDIGGAMQRAGAALQAASPPPRPVTCTSMPWVGGTRTVCQ
jgi:hypothetical protein